MTSPRPLAAALTAAVLSCSAQAALAGICEWQSPSHRLGLLELYTSEGCSSCPPADRWLSRLRPALRQDKLIPLAFHVDYWNQLGWPDRFASPQYTRRQQEAAERNRASFVYTPQFLLDGADFRPLGAPDLLQSRLGALNAEPAQARISARARREANGSIHIEGQSSANGPAAAHTFVALYEHGLVSAVKRGENAGQTLRHDYVVRALVGPLRADPDGVTRIDQHMAMPAGARTEQLGIAIFTQDAGTGRGLQASAAEGCL